MSSRSRTTETAFMRHPALLSFLHASRWRRVPMLALATAGASLLAACAADRPMDPARAVPTDGLLADRAEASSHQSSDVPSVVRVSVLKMLPNDVLRTVNGISVFNGGFGS